MNLLPALKTGRVIVAMGSIAILPAMLAELATTHPITVLDGGNRFPAYRIAQEIRKRSRDVQRAAERLFLRRAFTAYQVTHLLESAPAAGHPHILLDLLSTFQDDQVQPAEASRLLSICLTHIHRLSLSAPIALYLEPHLPEEKGFLLERVCREADEVFAAPENLSSTPAQPRLF